MSAITTIFRPGFARVLSTLTELLTESGLALYESFIIVIYLSILPILYYFKFDFSHIPVFLSTPILGIFWGVVVMFLLNLYDLDIFILL